MLPNPNKTDALRARCEAEKPVRWMVSMIVDYKLGISSDTYHVVDACDPDDACYKADAWAWEYYSGVVMVTVTRIRRV